MTPRVLSVCALLTLLFCFAAPSAQTQNAPSIETKNGRVRGTLTYYFNRNFGEKPDVGSQVWLVQSELVLNESTLVIGTPSVLICAETTRIKKKYAAKPQRSYDVLKYTLADGNGNFELLDVFPGEYTLILKSTHTKGTQFKREVTPRDADGRMISIPIRLKPGETVDQSYSFGMSSF